MPDFCRFNNRKTITHLYFKCALKIDEVVVEVDLTIEKYRLINLENSSAMNDLFYTIAM